MCGSIPDSFRLGVHTFLPDQRDDSQEMEAVESEFRAFLVHREFEGSLGNRRHEEHKGPLLTGNTSLCTSCCESGNAAGGGKRARAWENCQVPM